MGGLLRLLTPLLASSVWADGEIAPGGHGRNLLDFDVCGNFCGPGWCNGGWHSEWNADATHCGPHYTAPEVSPFSGKPACADVCCRAHDMCCAPGGDNPPKSMNKTRHCNRQIVECLNKCSGLDVSCTHGGIGVPADVVWAAMNLVEDWCCGHPCPKAVEDLPTPKGLVALGAGVDYKMEDAADLRRSRAGLPIADQVLSSGQDEVNAA